MKFYSHEQKEKATLALIREEESLWRKRRDLPQSQLKYPIQKGWKRYAVVRPDIEKSPIGKTIKDILKVIQHTDYCSRSDFMKRKGRSTRSRKELESIKMGTKDILVKKWEEKKYPDKWLRYFYKTTNKWGSPVYEFRYTWYLTPVIEKHWLTHWTDEDGLIRERLDEIDQIMTYNNLWAVHKTLRKGRSRDDWDLSITRNKLRSKYVNKDMQEDLSEYFINGVT